jgi:hypothetical protein
LFWWGHFFAPHLVLALRTISKQDEKQVNIQPDFATVYDFITKSKSQDGAQAPNIVPLFAQIPAEFLNPSSAYLKLSAK